jgi:hypothetical protein
MSEWHQVTFALLHSSTVWGAEDMPAVCVDRTNHAHDDSCDDANTHTCSDEVSIQERDAHAFALCLARISVPAFLPLRPCVFALVVVLLTERDGPPLRSECEAADEDIETSQSNERAEETEPIEQFDPLHFGQDDEESENDAVQIGYDGLEFGIFDHELVDAHGNNDETAAHAEHAQNLQPGNRTPSGFTHG